MLRVLPAIMLTVFLASASTAVAARDLLANGPQVGDPIPHDLSARDHNGQSTDFGRLKGARGVVLLFSRSFDW